MAVLLPQVQNLLARLGPEAAYGLNPGNFNDYVKYARGALNTGQTPNAAGFQQHQGLQAPPRQSPGGNKFQLPPQAPGAVSEAGQLNRVPMPQGAAQPTPPVTPGKNPRNLQYAAALSRMK